VRSDISFGSITLSFLAGAIRNRAFSSSVVCAHCTSTRLALLLAQLQARLVLSGFFSQ